MSILVNSDTRLLVQGITGRQGTFHTKQMITYGTKVVAGVSPGRGGQETLGLPIFNTIAEAVKATSPNASIIFVPPFAAADAALEAVDAGIPLIVCITDGIPTLDTIKIVHYARVNGCRVIGPNCPGVITPGQTKVGIMPAHIHRPGTVGVVSRSGTLTYEAVYALSNAGLGHSTCVGIGGDPVIGTSFVEVLTMFQEDPGTEAIALIGEIGGTDEEMAAEFIAAKVTKPVVAFIAGLTAPEGKRMGHAGAIISGGSGTAQEKIEALKAASVAVVNTPSEIADRMSDILK